MERLRLPALSLLCAGGLAGVLSAQHPAGLMAGMPPPGLVATAVNVAVGTEVLARIPAEACRGLGEFVAPGAHRIRGLVLHLLDASQGSGETFDVHVYLEHGASNLPTIQGPQAPGTTAVASELGLTTPAGVRLHEVPVVFAAPVDVPIGRDLFVGFVPQTPGLSLRALGGTSAQGVIASSIDSCGAALPLGSTFTLLHEAGFIRPMTTGAVGWQGMIDLLVDGSSGVAVAMRGPQEAPTASFFSGLHPDSRQPSHQTARHDVPGYAFRGNGLLPPGSPVFLLASVQPFAGQPWIVLSPGNAALLLSPVDLVALSLATADASGNAMLMWPVPRSNAVNGAIVRTQGFGFDLRAGAIRGGAAVLQQL